MFIASAVVCFSVAESWSLPAAVPFIRRCSFSVAAAAVSSRRPSSVGDSPEFHLKECNGKGVETIGEPRRPWASSSFFHFDLDLQEIVWWIGLLKYHLLNWA
ncbi:hypothetical protein AAHA92_21645 [Salvia divinorum]|uniref:Secreted protein n=1 Tax=Salvia divinorum TaxID=28513 RepID=A0ABD1GL35_SALDI